MPSRDRSHILAAVGNRVAPWVEVGIPAAIEPFGKAEPPKVASKGFEVAKIGAAKGVPRSRTFFGQR